MKRLRIPVQEEIIKMNSKLESMKGELDLFFQMNQKVRYQLKDS